MKYSKCPQTLALVLLAGCSQPNHLGNPLLLPVRAVASVAGEVNYQARRSDVKEYLTQHTDHFQAGPIPHKVAHELFRLGRIPPTHHAKVLGEVRATPPGPNWAEQATVIVMVHD